jgi:hypothetical protein
MSQVDAETINPSILIEQRTYEAGKEVTVGQKLLFGERLVDNKVYIFKGCGDEVLGNGKSDLHFTARVVSIRISTFLPQPDTILLSNLRTRS